MLMNLTFFACTLGLQCTSLLVCAPSVVDDVPKVEHNNYRFLFCSDKSVMVELSHDYFARLAELKSLECQAIPWSWVTECEGEEYSAFIFESEDFVSVKLKGLREMPSGDGGTAGIAGVVEANTTIARRCIDYWVIGVASTTPFSEKSKSPQETPVLPTSIRKSLRSMGKEYKVNYSAKIDMQTSIAIVKQKISEGREVVRVLYLDGKTVTELSFPENLFLVGKSLLIHDPHGETDVTPIEGELFALPDLDGNGYPEFIVDGNGTQLFAIEDSGELLPKISLKRSLYFGP